jgi:hypothetical protein
LFSNSSSSGGGDKDVGSTTVIWRFAYESAEARMRTELIVRYCVNMVPGSEKELKEVMKKPVTAGADIGAGPNAMQAGLTKPIMPQDDTLTRLRALYSMFPNDDLANMIFKYESRGR